MEREDVPRACTICLTAFLVLPAPGQGAAPGPKHTPTFQKDVAPILARYCTRCHGGKKPKGGIAFDVFKNQAAAVEHPQLWERVARNVRAGAMPPPGRRPPSAAEVKTLSRWVEGAVFGVDCSLPRDPGRVTIRRLNRAEYDNTIRDLVGIDFKPAKDFPDDDVGEGFDNIGDVLSLPPILMEKYLDAADKIVEEAFRNPAIRRKLYPGGGGRGRFRGSFSALREFVDRAYRRPATDEEVRRLFGLVRLARDNGDDTETGMKLAYKAVLVSPHFLFRVEKDPKDPDGIRQLDDFELATRLSYFLWSSMPDDELFDTARAGKLHERAVLEKQVRRMLRDRRSRALVDNFAAQWLQLRDLPQHSPDPKRFPIFNDALRRAMRRETELFFSNVIKEDRSILEFLDSDYTFVNARLARHYGIKGVKGEDFRRVSLAGTGRGGLLTQASVLTVTSETTRTSPVKRGKWVLENLLGTPPPPPPPNVPELKASDDPLKGTLRQQMEAHRANPICAACHQRMDPLGFALENFDAIGRWRTHEGKHKIDASGVLPGGRKFDGPKELRAILLKDKNVFARCLSEKLLTYALGRGLVRADRCTVDDIVRDLEKGDYRFSRLVLAIVTSDAFQKRKGKRGSR
jgi:hypothetical protein